MNITEFWLSNEIDKTIKEMNELSARNGDNQTYDYGFEIGQLQGSLNTLIKLYKMVTDQNADRPI